MKKKVLFNLVCVTLLCAALPLFASPTVKITAPVLEFNTGNTVIDTALNNYFVNSTELTGTINNINTNINNQLSGYGEQTQFAEGFGNANVFASRSSTIQGFQGYKLFSVSTGFMVGAQLPSSDLSELQNIGTNFEKDPDVYLGLVPALSFVNVGVNAGKIVGIFNGDLGDKLDRFYFSLKFGSFNYNYKVEEGDFNGDITLKTGNFGLGVNYQIVKPINLLLVKWRGVSLGSGFTYQKNELTMVPNMDTYTDTLSTYVDTGAPLGDVPVSMKMSFDPDIKMGLDISTFTIPLEASTAVQLLGFLNLTGGLGIDLAFGNSTINATASGNISVTDVSVNGVSSEIGGTPGTVTIDASTKDVNPKFVNPRLSTGIGFSLGPVKIDMPISLYIGSGYAFGVTAAFVW